MHTAVSAMTNLLPEDGASGVACQSSFRQRGRVHFFCASWLSSRRQNMALCRQAFKFVYGKLLAPESTRITLSQTNLASLFVGKCNSRIFGILGSER